MGQYQHQKDFHLVHGVAKSWTLLSHWTELRWKFMLLAFLSSYSLLLQQMNNWMRAWVVSSPCNVLSRVTPKMTHGSLPWPCSWAVPVSTTAWTASMIRPCSSCNILSGIEPPCFIEFMGIPTDTVFSCPWLHSYGWWRWKMGQKGVMIELVLRWDLETVLESTSFSLAKIPAMWLN